MVVINAALFFSSVAIIHLNEYPDFFYMMSQVYDFIKMNKKKIPMQDRKTDRMIVMNTLISRVIQIIATITISALFYG